MASSFGARRSFMTRIPARRSNATRRCCMWRTSVSAARSMRPILSNWAVGLWCAEELSFGQRGHAEKIRMYDRGIIYPGRKRVTRDNKLIDAQMAMRWCRNQDHLRQGVSITALINHPRRGGQGARPQAVRFQDLTCFISEATTLEADPSTTKRLRGSHLQPSFHGGPIKATASTWGRTQGHEHLWGAGDRGLQTWLRYEWRTLAHQRGCRSYRPSLEASAREKHKGNYSAIRVGPTSIGGDIINCKIGNEPNGTKNRAGNTAQYGLDIAAGAKGTWYHGNPL